MKLEEFNSRCRTLFTLPCQTQTLPDRPCRTVRLQRVFTPISMVFQTYSNSIFDLTRTAAQMVSSFGGQDQQPQGSNLAVNFCFLKEIFVVIFFSSSYFLSWRRTKWRKTRKMNFSLLVSKIKTLLSFEKIVN